MSKKKTKEFEVGDSFAESFSIELPQAKIDTLEGAACKVKEEGYTKVLNADELTAKRADLSDICIDINDIEEEKKEVVADFNIRLKEPKEDRAKLLASIKHKSEFRKANLYYIDDQENGFMYIFDEKGECVESRGLTPTEKQTSIKQLNAKIA
jgi:hypothetical protein